MGRNILIVIGGMLADIPETESDFRTELKSIKDSAMFSSPEMDRLQWERLAESVNDHIPLPPAPLLLWQQGVVDTFTGAKG